MTDLPSWVKELGLEGHIRCDEYEDLIRLKGSHKDPDDGTGDLIQALRCPDPAGYRLSYVNAKVEHKRGRRFGWMVTWIKNEVAERRYQEKHRMSRFTREEEAR